MARRPRKSPSITVDFSGVESRKTAEEGEQLATVTEVTQEEGQAGDYLAFKLKNEDGAMIFHNASLAEQSLWATKAWLEALGIDIPEEEVDLDLEDMVDREVMVNIEHETYQGKKQARIVDYWPADDKPKRGGKDKGGKSKKSPKPPTEDEVMNMTEEELEDVVKEQDLEVELDELKTLRKKRQAVADAL